MCDLCGDSSQYRLMLCQRCFRRLPAGLLAQWLAAYASAAKLSAAAAVFAWAQGQRARPASVGYHKFC